MTASPTPPAEPSQEQDQEQRSELGLEELAARGLEQGAEQPRGVPDLSEGFTIRRSGRIRAKRARSPAANTTEEELLRRAPPNVLSNLYSLLVRNPTNQ